MISTGIQLLNMINNRLLGYQGVATDRQLLEYAQEAKDEVWVVLKALQRDYFGEESQWLDPSQLNYFPTLTPSLREYTLPANFKSIRFIEPLQQGYEQIVFRFVEIDSPEFQSARRAANVDQSLSPTVEYWYTVYGRDRFIMAVYPEANMNIKLYYIRSLMDIVAYRDGTITTSMGSMIATLNSTTYTIAQMNDMVGADLTINNVDFGTIASVNPATQVLTLTTNAPSTQTAQKYTIDETLDQLVDPFTEKIADYAVKKILLAAQDQAQWSAWKSEWDRDVLALQTSASSRNDADAEFVQDFTG